jgi:hypothetical protein
MSMNIVYFLKQEPRKAGRSKPDEDDAFEQQIKEILEQGRTNRSVSLIYFNAI